jgi:hypothetical protein
MKTEIKEIQYYFTTEQYCFWVELLLPKSSTKSVVSSLYVKKYEGIRFFRKHKHRIKHIELVKDGSRPKQLLIFLK